DEPFYLASAHSAAFFYGAGHRLGRAETEASYSAITRDDVVAFHRDHYGPQGALLLAVGDLDPQWVTQEVERLFGVWQGPAAPEPEVRPVPALEASRVRWVARPGQTQVQIRLRQNGPARTADDWLALQIGNQILGSGTFASRLMQAIRSNLGQTYGIWTAYTRYRFPGSMELATFTRNESLWATLEAIQGELRRFYHEGVTEEELAKAKSQFLGSFPLQLETLSGTARLVSDALVDHGNLAPITEIPEQVAALTVVEVNEAIRAHLDPERFAVVLLGDPAVLETAPGPIFGVSPDQVEVVDWTEPVQGYVPAGD
ncbi:MAG TPA: pitrilysin family protein, partial [Limnochorda sp.]